MLINSDGKVVILENEQEPWNFTLTSKQIINIEFIIQNYIDNINDQLKLINGNVHAYYKKAHYLDSIKKAEDILNSIKEQTKDKKITVLEGVNEY